VLHEFLITSREDARRALCDPDVGKTIKNVVSIGEVRSSPPSGFHLPWRTRIRLKFDDVEHAKLPSYEGCTEDDVARIIRFGSRIAKDPKLTLVHCAAGISRSSAVTVVLLAVALGVGQEAEAVTQLGQAVRRTLDLGLRSDDYIRPNRRVVWMADKALGHGGALFGAVVDTYKDLYQDEFCP
jgi:predicted protein tyrosine phosphatase